jgi:hypothetical protein
MGKFGKRGLLVHTVLTSWMSAAVAAPPPTQKPFLHLDLHPSLAALSMENHSAAFPSPHRQFPGSQENLQLPNLGTEGAQARIPSRVEEFARRVHKEGLPVARLWENKSALVSLGLNQKGKPGLWIIQKVH